MWTDEQIEIAFLPVGCAEYASDAADMAMEIARKIRDEQAAEIARLTKRVAELESFLKEERPWMGEDFLRLLELMKDAPPQVRGGSDD